MECRHNCLTGSEADRGDRHRVRHVLSGDFAGGAFHALERVARPFSQSFRLGRGTRAATGSFAVAGPPEVKHCCCTILAGMHGPALDLGLAAVHETIRHQLRS